MQLHDTTTNKVFFPRARELRVFWRVALRAASQGQLLITRWEDTAAKIIHFDVKQFALNDKT